MPSGSNIRTIRFILLAFFTFAVIYKVRTSYYIADTSPTPKGGVGTTPKDSANGASSDHASHVAAPEKDAESQSVSDILANGRANATFVTLARNSDIWDMAESIRHVEDRFNHKYHYDWVFLNDKPFDDAFKKLTSALVSGKAKYGLIPKEHWGFPDFIDQDKAAKVREEMKKKKIIYGDSVSYRHMCRYESGFFFRHELMLDYAWYWRVEPSIKLFCNIDFDPFKYMIENKKVYGFVLSLYEYIDTIPTLWETVKGFMKEYPQHLGSDNAMKWLSDDGGKSYNKCHFWSNFEISSLDWLRSKAYMDYFTYLDKAGGFFYERWGDAPVHSIAAALFLKKEQLHFFNEIGYYHIPFTHCPTTESDRLKFKCTCQEKDNFDWKGYSCTSRYFDMMQMPKPEGWEKQSG